MPECQFRFLNEQRQALGDLKNTKRGKKSPGLAKFRNRSLKMPQIFIKKKKRI
jgi:hypothetical protein